MKSVLPDVAYEFFEVKEAATMLEILADDDRTIPDAETRKWVGKAYVLLIGLYGKHLMAQQKEMDKQGR